MNAPQHGSSDCPPPSTAPPAAPAATVVVFMMISGSSRSSGTTSSSSRGTVGTTGGGAMNAGFLALKRNLMGAGARGQRRHLRGGPQDAPGHQDPTLGQG